MRPDELERRLQQSLDAMPRAARAELLHVLMLPDLERADRLLQRNRRAPGCTETGHAVGCSRLLHSHDGEIATES